MANRTTGTQSAKNGEKVKRPCRFSKQHSDAMMVALGYAGVCGPAAEEVVKQLRQLANAGAPVKPKRSAGALAIYRVSWARSLMHKAIELSDQLESSDRIFDKDLHSGIGRGLSSSRKKSRAGGHRAVAATVQMAERVSLGAEYAFEQAVEQVFDGGTKYDQSLRELCRAVHDCWKAATSRPLPAACQLWRNECWASSAGGVVNPLWIVLDSLGINIRQSAVNCLVACANGEPVASVRLR